MIGIARCGPPNLGLSCGCVVGSVSGPGWLVWGVWSGAGVMQFRLTLPVAGLRVPRFARAGRGWSGERGAYSAPAGRDGAGPAPGLVDA